MEQSVNRCGSRKYFNVGQPEIFQCTRESCPTMSGGAKFEYLWQDGTKYKKPTHLPAPQYISLLMDWVESQINDENVGENVL